MAVGEAVHGAGRGHRRVLTVALGTGFGSGLTDDGVPVGEVHGEVIESLFRHTVASPDRFICSTMSWPRISTLLWRPQAWAARLGAVHLVFAPL